MKFLKKIFPFLNKKEEEEEVKVEKHSYEAVLFMKDKSICRIVGYYESGEALASELARFIRNETPFTAFNEDNDVLVIRGSEIESVRVISEPLEKE